MGMASSVDTPVLIVGAGPTGLSLALGLSHFGIKGVLLERHSGTSTFPKALGTHTRPMEVFMQWGVHAPVREIGAMGDAFRDLGVGKSYADPDWQFIEVQEENLLEYSPTQPTGIPQTLLEPVLLGTVKQMGLCDVRFNTELEDFAQDDSGVTATLHDVSTGQRSSLRAAYMVATDGWKGTTREKLGIARQGVENAIESTVIIFEANLMPFMANRPPVRYSFLTPPGGVPCYTTIYPPQAGEFGGCASIAVITPPGTGDFTGDSARIEGLVRAAIGAEIPFKIRAVNWSWASAVVADTFQQGRVLLAGDCAHLVVPTSGAGMNTGITDAHNLAWKLAFVLEGKADAALLDSYTLERKAVAEQTAHASLEMLKSGANISDNRVTIGLQLGYVSEHGAFTSDGTAAPSVDIFEYHPVARPGHRAPHLFLEQGRSILDLFGRDFVLLTGPGVNVVLEGLPVKHHVIGANNAALTAQFLETYGITATGAVLVRPDGMVAWRNPNTVSLASIEAALEHALGRQTAVSA